MNLIEQLIGENKTTLGTLFNLKQLHKKFGISVRTWREYIKRKELRAFKIGRSYFVSEKDVMFDNLIYHNYIKGLIETG